MNKQTFVVSKEVGIDDLPEDMTKEICLRVINEAEFIVSDDLLGIIIYPNTCGEFYDDDIEKRFYFDNMLSEINRELTDDVNTLTKLSELLKSHANRIDNLIGELIDILPALKNGDSYS
jgi:hypothetical protein